MADTQQPFIPMPWDIMPTQAIMGRIATQLGLPQTTPIHSPLPIRVILQMLRQQQEQQQAQDQYQALLQAMQAQQ